MYFYLPEVVDGLREALLEGNIRLPVQRALGETDVRPALLRVVLCNRTNQDETK